MINDDDMEYVVVLVCIFYRKCVQECSKEVFLIFYPKILVQSSKVY